MNGIRTWMAAAAFVSFALTAGAQTAQDLWPSAVGNEWTYAIEGRINDGQKFDVKSTQSSGGWNYLDGIDQFHGAGWGDRYWWMSATSGKIWVWNSDTARYTLVFDLGLAKGKTFKSSIDGDSCLNATTWEVADRAASIETPVGTFSNCVVIRVNSSPCADAGLGHMVFAPNVGLVEYSWTTIAGGHSAKLLHAIVNGVEYEMQPTEEDFEGLQTSLVIDRRVYTVTDDQEPIVPPGGRPLIPSTLKVRFVIANDTTETVTFDYRSSQRYDFVIRNDRGEQVYVWSANKRFMMALGRETLAPGKSLRWTDSIELRDFRDGKALPAGRYVIEGIHTTDASSSNTREKASTSFEIQLRVAR